MDNAVSINYQDKRSNYMINIEQFKTNFRWYYYFTNLGCNHVLIDSQKMQKESYKVPQNLKRLKNIRTLTIYYSDVVLKNQENYNTPFKSMFSDLCQALLELPKLQKFTLIVQALQGEDPKVDFQKLGDKFQFEIKQQWWKKENWG